MREATAPAPADSGMTQVVHRNIAALIELRRHEEQQRSASDRAADVVTRFAGSMRFVYVHAVYFGGWILFNLGLIPDAKPFDPFPFTMLAMLASVEAIFLSTFILITQNRMQKLADRRAELDLQISLLSEHELTQMLRLIDAVALHLNVPRPPEEDLNEIKKDIDPRRVVGAIEKAETVLDRELGRSDA